MTGKRHTTVMVIDDTPQNLKILEEFLGKQGYHVVVFPGGEMALKAAAKNRPDLVLLDIMMPGVDGYEVCRRFKADAKLKDVPIIFLSALSDTLDKTKAFSLGCVDYITKPFEFEEVDARVRTQLSLAAMRDELAAYSKRLEQLVDERTCQLRKANERLSVLDKAKSDFLNLISHELRTPLTGIIGIAEYLIEKSNDEDMRRIFEHSCARIISVVDEAQHFTELSVMDRAVENGLVDVVAILRDEVVMLEDAAKERGVTVAVRDTACSVVGDQYWVPACARYLLKTAVRLAEPRAVVVAEASRESGACIIKVSVPHDPIDQNVCASFFELFGGGAATPDPHFGLAPALAQRYAALLRGNVTLVCNDGYAVLTAAIPQSV